MRTILLAALALLLPVGAHVSAQVDTTGGFDFDADYWFNVFYPKIFYTPTEGLAVGAYYAMMLAIRPSSVPASTPTTTSVRRDPPVVVKQTSRCAERS